MSRARESNPLADPSRIAALRGTGLIGAKKADAFERVAELAATVARAPMAMVGLLDDTHLHALARVGAPDLATAPRTALAESFCRHVVAGAEPLVVEDAREHGLTKGLVSVKSGKVLAYAGLPLTLRGGHVLGTLCVADAKPRHWKASELSALEGVARWAVTELERRADAESRRTLQHANDRLRGLLEASPIAIYTRDLDGELLFANAAAERVGARADAVEFPLLDQAGEPYAICGIAAKPATSELGSAKALLRRLETAVDAAQSALASARPEDGDPK